MGNILLHKKVSIYKVYSVISINRTQSSFLDCKYKHMMKSGAPPYKVRVLHRLLPIAFHGFISRTDFKGLSLFGSLSYLNIFRDGMGPFKITT